MNAARTLIPALIGAAAITGAIGLIAPASGSPTKDASDGVGAPAASHATADRRGLLTVSVSGAIAGTGKLMVALYDRETGFPGGGKHFSAQVVPVTGATNEAVFADVPYGRYAVAIIYDKNGNGRLDMRLGVLPKEPLGFSNDAKARFGPPKFEDAAFDLNQPRKRTDVALR